MKTTKIHRRSPDHDWDYKAIVARQHSNGIARDIIYSKLSQRSGVKEGIEIYQGKNYIVGSNDRSYSRGYDITSVPEKYKDLVVALKLIHEATTWSNAEYVNEN